jgi:hypothetical protein
MTKAQMSSISTAFLQAFSSTATTTSLNTFALFVWLISHQPAVLFSQTKPAITNQPAVLFSQNKPVPATS